MDTEETNWLRRELEPGDDFDQLLPKVTCEQNYLGEGDTEFTVEQMAEWIRLYEWQTEKVARVLHRKFLKQTVSSIHDWLFDHLQYLADKKEQFLRSPACSWYSRRIGIDCKSYSIFASSLLLNMGISHYIRRIKQPGSNPNDWTHVYVVVPEDQTFGNLDKGYYVIDGTLEIEDEPIYLQSDDLKMSNLPHFGLNAPSAPHLGQPGLTGINISEIIKNFSWKKLSALTGAIDCIGGSALTDAGLKTWMDNIDIYFQGLVARINNGLQNNNFADVSAAVCEFYGNSKMFVQAAEVNLTEGWNSCTTNRCKAAIKALKFYRDTVGGLLKAYIADNYDSTGQQGTVDFPSKDTEKRYNFRFMSPKKDFVIAEPKINYVPKLTKSIPAFELTKYVVDQANAGQAINTETYLDTLTSIIKVFTPPSSGSGSQAGSSGSAESGSYTIDNTNNNNKDATKTAGFGWVWGIIIGGICISLITQKNSKTTPKSAA